MYREKEMWTDAYRLARTEGGEQEQKQVMRITVQECFSNVNIISGGASMGEKPWW